MQRFPRLRPILLASVLILLIGLPLALGLVALSRRAQAQGGALAPAAYLPIVLRPPAAAPTATPTATPWLTPSPTPAVSTVVGNGTPQSCTESALATALARGGLITFNCGPDPVAIGLSRRHIVAQRTILDGGNRVALDGRSVTGILQTADAVSLTLRNITLQNGVSGESGGALRVGKRSTVSVLNATLRVNSSLATPACDGGGAIFADAGSDLRVENSHFLNNSANNGGAINAERSRLVILNSRFEGNRAHAAVLQSVATLDDLYTTEEVQATGICGGAGAIYLDGTRSAADGGPDDVLIEGSTFRSNSTNRNGGALFVGLRTYDRIDIRTTTFVDNAAVMSSNPDWSGMGGAVWIGPAVDGQFGTVVRIERSTFSNNQGHFRGGALWTRLPATITNTTFTGNIARNPAISDRNNWRRGSGGALAVLNQVQVVLDNVTIAGNQAGYDGGGVNGSTTAARNTIIADNSAEILSGQQQNCTVAIQNWGYNLQYLTGRTPAQQQVQSGCGSGILANDPRLGPLGQHGGPTLTMPLLTGSAAINAGNNSTCAGLDQRGILRPQAGVCDIGAFELEAPLITPTSTPTPTPTGTRNTPTSTPSITPTPTGTRSTPTSTPSITPTPTPSRTPSPTLTPTPSRTPSPTPTPDGTPTATPTATPTPSGGSVVGNGTPESCTEAALVAALQSGGYISFNCGPNPVTIPFTQRRTLTADAIIEGGGRVTFDGRGQNGILGTGANRALTLLNLRFVNANSAEQGGALRLGTGNTLTVVNSTFENNISTAEQARCQGGGAIFVDEGSIVVLADSVFIGNRANNGGAIRTNRAKVTVSGSRFEANEAQHSDAINAFGDCGGGGAILIDGTRRASQGGPDTSLVVGNTFAFNKTNNHGGALFVTVNPGEGVRVEGNNFLSNEATKSATSQWSGTGGAIRFDATNPSDPTHTAVVERAAFIGNKAQFQGGAIWSDANLTAVNATLYGNYALNPAITDNTNWQRGNGGGISMANGARATLTHLTLADNVAGFNGGGLHGPNITARNSIIANNNAENGPGNMQNCSDALVNEGGNIQWLNFGSAGSRLTRSNCGATIPLGNPNFGPLDDYGGNTFALNFWAGSAAYNAALSTHCVPTDQRGVARPQGAACDIGAFELVGEPQPEPPPVPQIVGDGTPESCTQEALALAITRGGNITFNCGPDPVVIPFTTSIEVVRRTALFGGNKVTLDGRNQTAILRTQWYVWLELHDIALVNGRSTDQGAAVNLGYFAILIINNTRFDGNVSTADHAICDGGGAIFIGGGSQATITNSLFTNNVAPNGGAINNLRSQLTIRNTHFESNHAIHTDAINAFGDCGGGGALYFDGTRRPEDGGPDNVIIEDSTFINNTTNNHGGAIFYGIRSNEVAVLRNLTFTGNRAVVSPSMAGSGTAGALWLGPGVGGQTGYSFLLENSTFNNNSSQSQGGAFWSRSPARVINSTFVGNEAINPNFPNTDWRRGNGGAITAAERALVELNNVTIVGNTAGFNGGGVAGENVAVSNTIVANNVGQWSLQLQQNCTHFLVNRGNNLHFLLGTSNPNPVGQSNCGATLTYQNPVVGALGNYGGPTQTVPLLAGSAAIDTGNNATCAAADQRGVTRPQGPACDIGAFEVTPTQAAPDATGERSERPTWPAALLLPLTLPLAVVWQQRRQRAPRN